RTKGFTMNARRSTRRRIRAVAPLLLVAPAAAVLTLGLAQSAALADQVPPSGSSSPGSGTYGQTTYQPPPEDSGQAGTVGAPAGPRTGGGPGPPARPPGGGDRGPSGGGSQSTSGQSGSKGS